jgi:hypothetical protein
VELKFETFYEMFVQWIDIAGAVLLSSALMIDGKLFKSAKETIAKGIDGGRSMFYGPASDEYETVLEDAVEATKSRSSLSEDAPLFKSAVEHKADDVDDSRAPTSVKIDISSADAKDGAESEKPEVDRLFTSTGFWREVADKMTSRGKVAKKIVSSILSRKGPMRGEEVLKNAETYKQLNNICVVSVLGFLPEKLGTGYTKIRPDYAPLQVAVQLFEDWLKELSEHYLNQNDSYLTFEQLFLADDTTDYSIWNLMRVFADEKSGKKPSMSLVSRETLDVKTVDDGDGDDAKEEEDEEHGTGLEMFMARDDCWSKIISFYERSNEMNLTRLWSRAMKEDMEGAQRDFALLQSCTSAPTEADITAAAAPFLKDFAETEVDIVRLCYYLLCICVRAQYARASRKIIVDFTVEEAQSYLESFASWFVEVHSRMARSDFVDSKTAPTFSQYIREYQTSLSS